MKLSDVEWRSQSSSRMAYVSSNNKQIFRLRHYLKSDNYRAFITDDEGRALDIALKPTTSLLEVACWLADKEPYDAPDPHPDY